MSTALEVQEVTKRFKIPVDRAGSLKYRFAHPISSSRHWELLALAEVSFGIDFGEFVGVIGDNGSGKSTLLKILARIYRPTRGGLRIHGFVSPFLELGVGFHPELTARENVYLNGAILGLTRNELAQRMDDIIHFAELEHFVDQKLKNFSSGMLVRLAFSVAIQAGAGILLMDEVLAVGDAHFQEKCFDVFARYKREGRTVVLVTHDLSAVDRYCDRVLLLDHGKLIKDGPAAEVTAHYRRLVSERSDHDSAGGQPLRISRGTGEASITSLLMLDTNGRPQQAFRPGDPMTIEVGYELTQPTRPLRCQVSVYRADGLQIAELRSQPIASEAASDSRTGNFRYRVDALPLLGGTYGVAVRLEDRNGGRPFAWLDRPAAFKVIDEDGRAGLLDFAGRWLST